MRADPPGPVAPFGAGCAGSIGTPFLDAPRLPWIGDRWTLVAGPLPAAQPVALLVGASDRSFGGAALPFDLGRLGMPGCSLAAAAELTLAFGAGSGGSSRIRSDSAPSCAAARHSCNA